LCVRAGESSAGFAMTDCDTAAIAAWLIEGARSAPAQVLAALCERLLGAGMPLWRAGVFVRTLHPQVMGRRFVWRLGSGVEVMDLPYALLDSPEFEDSLAARVCQTGAGVRRRLDDGAGPLESAFLAQLRQEGATDYLALPLTFSDGAIHVATWTTRQNGGFAATHVAGIEAILAPFARVAENRALRRTAANLLDTYVGHRTGERILAGHIRRGDTQAIEAAIWLSDMRGFTARADRFPPQVLIDFLNRYFDCQVPAIEANGGEVLKFMGDGLLAIFPTADQAITEACARAVAAALVARAEIAGLAVPTSADAVERVRFGLALHVGAVLYGNIGGGNRLDFTCIGPAVNLAARIEKLTGTLGRTVLVSQDFARHCGHPLTSVGAFQLAGFSAPQSVFGFTDES
jgi:adenylate cyclase